MNTFKRKNNNFIHFVKVTSLQYYKESRSHRYKNTSDRTTYRPRSRLTEFQ